MLLLGGGPKSSWKRNRGSFDIENGRKFRDPPCDKIGTPLQSFQVGEDDKRYVGVPENLSFL